MRAEESLNSDVVRHFAVRHDKKGMGEERGGGGEGRGGGGGEGKGGREDEEREGR